MQKIVRLEDKIVIVTNLEGARGIDYVMAKEAHVIMAFNPTTKALVMQALGRGSRSTKNVCSGTIVAWSNRII